MNKLSEFPRLPLLILGIFIMACQTPDKGALKGFYMPKKAKKGGVIHQFESKGLQSGKEYWYYNLRETADSTNLIITVYDEHLNQQQLSVEKELSNGWVQQQLLLFFPDSTGTQTEQVDIHTGNRFVFDLQDSVDVLLYRIEWQERLDQTEATKRLFRNNRFMGFDTLQLLGADSRAAHFRSRDKIEDDRQGTLTLDLVSDEYYVKDWGLVAKKQFYMDNGKEVLLREMKLTDTLRMNDMEQLLKDKY